MNTIYVLSIALIILVAYAAKKYLEGMRRIIHIIDEHTLVEQSGIITLPTKQ